jgi:HEPN domain-containing protein
MSSAVDHLAMARRHLDEAYKLLERGDPFDAAEKIGQLSNTLQQP